MSSTDRPAPSLPRRDAAPGPIPVVRPAAALAYPLLLFTMLLWGGNVVAAKWAVGEVSPQVLTCLRWAFACLALLLPAWRGFVGEWDRLRRHWPYVLAMGAGGYTVYASLFYAAGRFTSGINVALFQGAVPVLVILLNYLVRRVPVGAGQVLGVCVTLAGAMVAATHGDWRVLTTLGFNLGDGLMLAACLVYAGYTVALPARPKVSALTFFMGIALAGFVTALPPLAVESALGQAIWPSPRGWAIVVFVALGPSLGAQLAFLRAVELIGPNRAGLFINLVPIFGAALSVLVVGEAFRWHDAVAFALVLGGIVIAERFGRPPR